MEKEIWDDATRLLKSVLNFTRNVDDIQVSEVLYAQFYRLSHGSLPYTTLSFSIINETVWKLIRMT